MPLSRVTPLAVSLLGFALVLAGCTSSPTGSPSGAPTAVMPTSLPSTSVPSTAVANPPPPTAATASPEAAGSASPTGLVASTSFGIQAVPCTYGQVAGQAALPDGRCTPGAVNPAVTQATIGSTICVAGYSSSIRPAESVTYAEKRAAMAAYSAPGSTSLYEYDHLVSLSVGGAANTAANLWPEPLAGPYGARVKDRLESRLHALICDGALSLADAQRQEAADWTAAYRRYVGPLP